MQLVNLFRGDELVLEAAEASGNTVSDAAFVNKTVDGIAGALDDRESLRVKGYGTAVSYGDDLIDLQIMSIDDDRFHLVNLTQCSFYSPTRTIMSLSGFLLITGTTASCAG